MGLRAWVVQCAHAEAVEATGEALSSRECCNSLDVAPVGGSVRSVFTHHRKGWWSPTPSLTQPSPLVGANPSEIRLLYNVVGSIGARAQEQGLHGSAESWIETLTQWATDLGLDTFVFWPRDASEQVRLFAEPGCSFR